MGLRLDKPGHGEDRAGLPIDRTGQVDDKYPARGLSAFQSAPPPGGTGGGISSGLRYVVERFPPYTKQGDGKCLRFVSASRRAGSVDGGNSGKSRAAPCAVHFTLDFSESGTGLYGERQATYFLYFLPVNSSPFSARNCFSGLLSYRPSISFL